MFTKLCQCPRRSPKYYNKTGLSYNLSAKRPVSFQLIYLATCFYELFCELYRLFYELFCELYRLFYELHFLRCIVRGSTTSLAEIMV